MQIDWTSRTLGEWRALMQRLPRTNWLQSLPFAMAARSQDQKVTRLAVIKREDVIVGMMAMQEIKLGPIHVLNLYRGPLWFKDDPPQAWFEEFAKLFNKLYPRRLFRRRRWLPEWKDSALARQVLMQFGFKYKSQSYETVWLDLTHPEEDLRAQLKQKWRNALNKGERSNLRIEMDWQGKSADHFLSFYAKDKKEKGYRGRSARFIKAEILAALKFRDVLIAWAYQEQTPIAAILLFLNGNSAAYRAGWNTVDGRKVNAHNVLLWDAVKTLKAKGLKNFDLGGVEPFGAHGLTHFKQGMGGEECKLVGVFS